MKGVTVDFTDERDSKEIMIPELLPFQTGIKIRRKLNISITGDKKSTKATMEDGMGVLADCQEVVFEEIIKPKLSEEEQSVIDMASVDRVLEEYWQQVQGIIKKKAQRQESTTR